MRIQLFKNGKGLIYGTDSKRIGCDIAGTLNIGSVKIDISSDRETIMPQLFNGCSGTYNATFTSASGSVYRLERVEVNGGRIVPPPKLTLEYMEMQSRLESLEAALETMSKEMTELRNIFDTNSLNFLIN